MANTEKNQDESLEIPHVVATVAESPHETIPPADIPTSANLDPAGQISAATRASGGAVAKFVSESEPRPGKRGRKPKGFGAAASDSFVETDNLSPGDPGGAIPDKTISAGFDEKIFSTLIAGFVEMVSGLGVAAQTGLVFNLTKDRGFSRECGNRAAMGKETREMANASLLSLAKKYSSQMQYAPEVATCVCFGLWAGSNFLQYQMVKKDWGEIQKGLKPENPVPVKPGNVS